MTVPFKLDLDSLEKNKKDVPKLVLTEGQKKAYEAFVNFLLDKNQPIFILEGYAGTGKSTLVRELFNQLDDIQGTIRLTNPSYEEYPCYLTATTNKAAAALEEITGQSVTTIHSFLGLRVKKNYRTLESQLISSSNDLIKDSLIFIDEASYVDSQLLKFILDGIDIKTSKIVFMGDPAQLTPVKSNKCPVFSLDAPKASLTEVVRQAKGNPIIDLATKFRETVSTGEFFSFTPDNVAIKHVAKDEFKRLLLEEFCRPDWKYHDSKILAWTNKKVVEYNDLVRANRSGSTVFKPGDYVINNSFISLGLRKKMDTDELVYIDAVKPHLKYDVPGNLYTVISSSGKFEVFCPNSLADKEKRIKELKTSQPLLDAFLSEDSYCDVNSIIADIQKSWADLREVFACTINKSQGSTYDKVFIDLSDVSKCKIGNQLARLLYVAVSRARHEVIFTGDLV